MLSRQKVSKQDATKLRGRLLLNGIDAGADISRLQQVKRNSPPTAGRIPGAAQSKIFWHFTCSSSVKVPTLFTRKTSTFRTTAFAAIAGILTTFSSAQAVTLAHWDFEQYSDGSAIPLGFEVVPESALIMDVSGNGRHLSKPLDYAMPSSTTEGREPGTVAADFYGSCMTEYGECDYYEFNPQEMGVDDINFGPTNDFTLEAIALIPLNLDREDAGPSYRLQEGGLVGKGGGGEGIWNLSILHRKFFPGTRGHRLETFAGRPF